MKNKIFTLNELIIVIACLGLTATLMLGAATSAKSAQAACLANLKNIGGAISAYAADSDGYPPVVFQAGKWESSWCLDNQFVTYLKLKPTRAPEKFRTRGNVLECPADDPAEHFTKVGYVMNGSLLTLAENGSRREGGKISSFSAPAKTLAVMDGVQFVAYSWCAAADDKNRTRARHEGDLDVLFLDGSTGSAKGVVSALENYDAKRSWKSDNDL